MRTEETRREVGSTEVGHMVKRLALVRTEMARLTAVIVGLGVALLVAGVVIAATPFGGDDSGFIPPDKNSAKCELSVAKNVRKTSACILGCHKKRASGVFTDETGEDG